MKILVTNDDGIGGEGLCVLVSALESLGHELVVVAPKCNNSAVSHKINMHTTVRIEKVGENRYAVDGTPADCVLLALRYLSIEPDLLLSGINTGVNVGSDVLYSGTVAAALEGAQNGIPSVALSQYLHAMDTPEKITSVLHRTVQIIGQELERYFELSKETGAVNINFPPREPLGVRFCMQAKTVYNTSYRETDEGLRMEFHPPRCDCAFQRSEIDFEKDIPSIREGYITITPLKVDLTDYETLARWKRRA